MTLTPRFFCVPYHVGGYLCADVADMDGHAVAFRKGNLPGGAGVFGSSGHTLYSEGFGYSAFVYLSAGKIGILTVSRDGDS